MRAILAAYVAVGLLNSMWFDAMDRAHVVPELREPFPVQLLIGAFWPLTLPISLWALTLERSRWHNGTGRTSGR